jgi:hypothetical protein
MILRIKQSAMWVAVISLMVGMMSTVVVAPANADPISGITLSFDGNDPVGTLLPNSAFGNSTTQLVADPSVANNQVLEFTRKTFGPGPAGQTWQGVTVFESSTVSLINPDTATVTLRINSPAANTPVLLKLETAGGGALEVTETTTGVNTWETLTYDFSLAGDASLEWVKAAIFPNFGAENSSDEIYLIDDVSFAGAVEIVQATQYAEIRLLSADTAMMTNKTYWGTDNVANHSWVKMVVAGSQLLLHYKVSDST